MPELLGAEMLLDHSGTFLNHEAEKEISCPMKPLY